MARHVILQKFYVYDPSVHAGDELGSLRVLEDKDNDGALHVLASPIQIQYWIDQGMLGSSPLSKMSEPSKKLLAQITRGRSESDDEPVRVPKYSKAMQSGAPQFAGTLADTARAKSRAKAAKKKDGKNNKKTTTKRPAPPPTSAV